jgi:hypothetical protein
VKTKEELQELIFEKTGIFGVIELDSERERVTLETESEVTGEDLIWIRKEFESYRVTVGSYSLDSVLITIEEPDIEIEGYLL